LLHPEHPRKDTDEAIKTFVQRDFAECIQQISLFAPGCDALKAVPGVVEALDALIEQAWSEEAKDCARGALMQLTGRHPDPVGGGRDPDAGHIMISCKCAVSNVPSYSPADVALCDLSVADQWDVQETIQMIVHDLKRRNYLVWFDCK
jgi:hypothetical protein